MQILKIEHFDFDLIVECKNFYSAFNKARAKQGNFDSSTNYTVTTGAIFIIDPHSAPLKIVGSEKTHPIFFENKEYFIEVTFKNKASIESPHFYSKLKAVHDSFFYRESLGYIAGTINYGNDIGKTDLTLRYLKDRQLCEFTFNFEVFPTKLDYKNDYDRILADIEQEYPSLVLDFLKKTYSSFKTGSSPTTDLIWWQVFGGLYEEFIRASTFILNRPHNRILKNTRHLKADRIIKWTSKLEEEFAQNSHLPGKSYTSAYKRLTTNTPENQFVKYAVQQTSQKFRRVNSYITDKFRSEISQEFKSELSRVEKQLEVIVLNPFFKSISDFRGIRQESLVLQRATGYSSIYKTWIILNSGIKFLEGIQKLELKNIADLYEVWCFLEIKGIVQDLLGKDRPDEVEIAELEIDDFVFRIKKGVKSRVSFRQASGDLVEIFHEFPYENENNELRSFTVAQAPDIVIKISKNDLKDNYVLTYLYDAKYRLRSDDNPNSPDVPTEDAINQMHRYRDAIYYVNKEQGNRPEKEVIGAYILFPGSGDLDQIKESSFYKSIEKVNIGAFPLKPNDSLNKVLLKDHLRTILHIDTERALRPVAPQKRTRFEEINPEVLIGIVPDTHLICLMDTATPFYYTGRAKPSYFGYQNLRYFAPYIKGEGISAYFEILGYELISRNSIFEPGHPLYSHSDTSERLLFRLGNRISISPNQESYKLVDGTIRLFRYTKLSFIRQPKDGKIEVLRITKDV